MNKKYTAIMVLAFIYGGFLLTSYAFMVYSILWRGEVPGVSVFAGGSRVPVIGGSRFMIPSNGTETNRTEGAPSSREFARQVDPIEMLASPLLLFILAGGLISLASGIAIRSLTHEKEVKKLRKDLKELYLNPEEKRLLDEIESSNGQLTQKELTDRTGYSRVKVHRILEKLEEKKIIRRVPYGMTNKIILNQT